MIFITRCLASLTVVGVTILPTVLAGGDDCCKFTLSSKGAFACPAGQLADGQIRLNGTEPESTFCLDSKGGIIDQNGYGCIVTGAPTTQIQCDAGKAPDAAFSIDSSSNLEYNGSSSFFACPATDTDYNVYVAPNFGQAKCIPITLQASGCQAQISTSSAGATSTVTSIFTQIQTITDNPSAVTQTITQTVIETGSKPWTQTMISTLLSTVWETTTEIQPCTPSATSSFATSNHSTTTPSCDKCTKTSSIMSFANSTTNIVSSTIA